MAWLRLAFGNLRVNRRRTAITLLSVAVGVGGLVFLWAFIDGINAQMINNMTGYVTGDLKVHQRGFHDDREMNIALAERWNLTEEVSAVAGVAATTPRVTGHALASREDQSRALQVMGVDSATEDGDRVPVTPDDGPLEVGAVVGVGVLDVGHDADGEEWDGDVGRRAFAFAGAGHSL